jgi:hypothetical protein
MGNLKVGDKIIVTEVLQIGKSLDHLKFTIQEISSIHTPEDYYPYKIEIDLLIQSRNSPEHHEVMGSLTQIFLKEMDYGHKVKYC